MNKLNITYTIENMCFNYRVAGVIKQNTRFLLHRKPNDSFWNLVGGRVRMGEDSESALQREILEELGCRCKTKSILNYCENFFEMDNNKVHEILIVYEIELVDEISLRETESNLIFKWFDKSEIDSLSVKPIFLKGILMNSIIDWNIVNHEL